MDAMKICTDVWVAWIAIWLLWALQSKRTQQRESVASRFSYAIVLWVAGDLLFFRNAREYWWDRAIFPHNNALGWAGVAITVAGFAFTLWARFILGGNWSGSVTIKVGHELILRGPYRWVRHPIYTGMIVAAAGTALARNEWRGLLALPFMWAGFTVKRLKEEQFMRQTFGAQYNDYAQTTGAIFPALLRRDT